MHLKKPVIILYVLLILLLLIVRAETPNPENLTYSPGEPKNLAESTKVGSFWVNYTWAAGENTDSFNVSVNGEWYNGTTEAFKNTLSSPHGWVNISVAGYNATSQLLSNSVRSNTQVPNNPITLTDVSTEYSLYEGQTLYIHANYTDIDGDKGTFSTNAKGNFDTSTGILSWTTQQGDKGTYDWQISVSDGYQSTSTQTFKVTVMSVIPTVPANLRNTTGNFWINWAWNAGKNTDDYNILIDNSYIGTEITDLSYNLSNLTPHATKTISVRSHNHTSNEYSSWVNQTTTIPNNEIYLTDVLSSYSLNEGDTLYIHANYTDADGDKGTFDTSAPKGTFNSSTGILSWKTGAGDHGSYNWQINVTDGYGSVSKKDFTVTVNAYTPGVPAKPVASTKAGSFWVNYTWSAGANTSSFNISVNGEWYNGSIDSFKNTLSSPHGWVNISVAGYNATSQLLSNFVYETTSVPNNPIALADVKDKYSLNEGDTLYIDANYTDADGDKGTFSTNADRGTFNSSTGILSWSPVSGGIYNWQISVTDGYGSTSTQNFTVIVPLNFSMKFIEPGVINNNGTWVETWRSALVGHAGKFIGIDGTFKNTGQDSLTLTVSDNPAIYVNESGTRTVTLSKGQSVSFTEAFEGRRDFEINSTKIEWIDKTHGFFNYTLKINVNGYSGSTPTFSYSNTSTISLPIYPIFKTKRANGDIAAVIAGGTTTITYTLEANSSVNLTNVSIYDTFYPRNGGYFNISSVEANHSSNTTYTYGASSNDLNSNKFKCEEGYPCIINLATFTGKINSTLINDTDYVEIPLGVIPRKESSSGSSSGGSSGSGGGGGGGGMPPSEDFNNTERREVREMDVLAGYSSTYTFKEVEPVMVVGFESSVSENEVPVAVEILKGRSKQVGVDAPGRVYKYFNVFVGTSGFRNKVGNGVVVYQVSNAWLKENGLEPEDISLYKWNGEWIEKSTEIAENKSKYTYYASLVGNFSSFAIAGVKKQKIISSPIMNSPMVNNSAPGNNLMSNTNATGINQSSSFGTGRLPGAPVLLPAVFVFVVGIIVAGYYINKHKYNLFTKHRKELYENSSLDNSNTPAGSDSGSQREFWINQP